MINVPEKVPALVKVPQAPEILRCVWPSVTSPGWGYALSFPGGLQKPSPPWGWLWAGGITGTWSCCCWLQFCAVGGDLGQRRCQGSVMWNRHEDQLFSGGSRVCTGAVLALPSLKASPLLINLRAFSFVLGTFPLLLCFSNCAKKRLPCWIPSRYIHCS